MMDKKSMIVCGIVVIGIILWLLPDPNYYVKFHDDGILLLVRQGWNENEMHPLAYHNNVWGWVGSDRKFNPIDTPFTSKYNDYGWTLVLDKGGSVYRINKDGSIREPIEFRKGEWQMYATGEWLSMF
jgi:hypothetical protein